MKNMTDNKVYRIVLTALMAALCYVAFTFLKIPIPTFGGDYVALHIGNAFCVLAALLLGGADKQLPIGAMADEINGFCIRMRNKIRR